MEFVHVCCDQQSLGRLGISEQTVKFHGAAIMGSPGQRRARLPECGSNRMSSRGPVIAWRATRIDMTGAAGVPVTFYTVKGGGHGLRNATVDDKRKEFFARHLKSAR